MGEKGDPLAMMADAPEVAKWADAYSAYAQFQQSRAARREMRAEEQEKPDAGAEAGPGPGDASG
jgi:hypothetical protein